MNQRCRNPRDDAFAYYGGRGIKVCKRWRDFKNFLADMGTRPPEKTLDRQNNEGDYKPSNCRWATHKEQQRNSRTCKLTAEQVAVIRSLNHLTYREIGLLFGISDGHAWCVKNKKNWA